MQIGKIEQSLTDLITAWVGNFNCINLNAKKKLMLIFSKNSIIIVVINGWIKVAKLFFVSFMHF